MALLDRIPPAVLELAEILRPTWSDFYTGPLVAEGDPDPEPDPKPDPKGGGDPEPEPEPGPDPEPKGDPDWKSESRKHERREKQERKKREEAEKRLKDLEDKDKSEQERAIEKAREEAKEEASTEAEKARREDRLEVAVTRLASKGIKLGEGDDAETVRFADSEDALLRVQRAVARGDIDPDDIFDSEGKVQTGALNKELAEILNANSHLRAGSKDDGKPSGGSDAGKGSGSGKALEDMSIDDHEKQIRRHKD